MLLTEQIDGPHGRVPDPTDMHGPDAPDHESNHPLVIAFAGYTGAGKDTAAGFLKDWVADFVFDSEDQEARVPVKSTSFAKPVKEMLKYIYNLSDNDVYGHEDRAARERPHPHLAGMSPRRAMQLIATEGYRHLIDDDTWVAHWFRNEYVPASMSNPNQILYLTDFRFVNEFEFMRANCPNLLVYFIERRPKTKTQLFIDRWDTLNLTRRRSHDSERQIDELMRTNRDNPQWATISNKPLMKPSLVTPGGSYPANHEESLNYFREACYEAFVEDIAWRFMQ